MSTSSKKSWKNYGFDFLSIFIAVISAFALNNWNDNRRSNLAEQKILNEISNGLKKDIEDVEANMQGHKEGIKAIKYFRSAIGQKEVPQDSAIYYYIILTRDFISIQNRAGYETLKSRGLELIQKDSLRTQIISMYEYDYNILQKLEEEYSEMQFNDNYFKEINQSLAPNIIVNDDIVITGMSFPLNIPNEEKNVLLLYLFKMHYNRMFILQYYKDLEEKIKKIIQEIDAELND